MDITKSKENDVKQEKSIVEDIRMDKKVLVKSIANWITGAKRITTNGDISVPVKGSILLSREEIIAQAQNGNTLLSGIDGLGSHATWYVDDEFTRKELSFESEDNKQSILTFDEIKRIFSLKTPKSFEENIKEKVVTRAEKAYLLDCIKQQKINDYDRISFCIKYTGMKM